MCFFPSRHIIKNLANTFTSRLSHLALPRSVSSTFLLTSSKNGFIISCSHTEERCDSHLLHKLRVLKFNSRSAFSPCLIYHLCALIFSSNCLARWRELNSRDTVSASYPSHLCFIKKTPELGLEINEANLRKVTAKRGEERLWCCGSDREAKMKTRGGRSIQLWLLRYYLLSKKENYEKQKKSSDWWTGKLMF